MEAYDLVKRGEYFYYRRSPGDIERSIGLFEQAIRPRSDVCQGLGNLAGAYSMAAWSVDSAVRVVTSQAGRRRTTGGRLDPSLGSAQARLAQYY